MGRSRTTLLFGLLLVIFAFVGQVVPLYTDWLWFQEVGYRQVFLTMLSYRGGLFTAVAVGVLVASGLLGVLAATTARSHVQRGADLLQAGLDASRDGDTETAVARFRAARAALAERASRRQRLAAALMPRSVLLRWRTTWVGWMARAVSVAGQVREFLAVLSPRRLLTGRGARTSP